MTRRGGLIPSHLIALALFGRERRRTHLSWWTRSARNGYGAPSLGLAARRRPEPLWVRVAAAAIAVPLVAILVAAAFCRPFVAWGWTRWRAVRAKNRRRPA